MARNTNPGNGDNDNAVTENGAEIARTGNAGNGELSPVVVRAMQFTDYLRRRAEEDAQSAGASEAMANQLSAILDATEFDAIMDADNMGTHESKDLVGLHIRIHDQRIRVAKSAERFNSPLGHYVQFHATALTAMPSRGISIGDDLLISSGATLVIGKLRTLEANGHFPCDVQITGHEAQEGTVVKLGKIPATVVQSSVS